MEKALVLQAERRHTGVKPKHIRKDGKIPAVSYGRGKETVSLTVEYQTFRKVFEKAGENTVIELHMNGEKLPALVHDVQFDPVSDKISHVDFYLVDMTKEVTTKIPVKCIGISPAVKNLGGILTVHKHEINVKCLPQDLIPVIEVDVSSLENFHSSIHVKDLKVPATIKILDNSEDAVVNARPPKVEEEAPKPAEVLAEGAAAAPAEGAAVPGAPTAPQAQAPTEQKQEKKKEKA